MPSQRLIAGVATAVVFSASASVTACHDANGPAGAPGSMVVIRQDAPTDSVNGAPAILVLRIFDGAGRPAARTPIDFRGPIVSRGGNNQVGLYIAPDTTRPLEQWGEIRSVTTDADGRVAVAVLRRTTAGRLAVGVTSALIQQLRDSVVFITTPGPLAGVIVTPSDSATTVGAAYNVTGTPVDAWGNARTEAVTYAIGMQRAVGPGVDRSAPVASLAGQTLRGLQTGRARIDATAGARTGSGWISVVPRARLAAIDPTLAAGELPALVLVNTDGTGLKSFPLNRYSEGHPRWFPAQGRLVLEEVPANGQDPSVPPRLAVIDTLSGVHSNLVGDVPGISGEYRPSVDSRTNEVYLAGVASAPGVQSGVAIYRVDADRSGAVRIGPSVDAYTTLGEPDVSPDGSTLVVRRNGALMRMDVATGALTRLGDRGESYDARWSPDGRRVAFRDQTMYWIIDADGSNERALTDAAIQADVFPGHSVLDWSPDGGWLLIRANGRLQLLDPTSGETLPLPAMARLVAAAWGR